MQREKFSGRLGFILITAGCAIGLGNVWRFPYITGQYGGALFVFLYIGFLILVGIPILSAELAVGRASGRSLGSSFETLTPSGTHWRRHKYWMIAGNYVLLAFYSMVTGWMLYYSLMMLGGELGGLNQDGAGAFFGTMLSRPALQELCTLVVVAAASLVCAAGLRRGVERVTKPMMLALLLLLVFLALRSVFLPGAAEGLAYYLKPEFDKVSAAGLGSALSAAMGQAFFTLGLGVGSIQIFGSYMHKSTTILSESVLITVLDTVVALLAGFVIFPACFSYGIRPGEGAGLVFITLVEVFADMEYGRLWGSLFFVFMLCAALSTLIAVFENIIAVCMELFGISRRKSALMNAVAVLVLGLPCILGFNLLSEFHPLGGSSGILDLYDFVLSSNILPLGALCYILYISLSRGWGFEAYLGECNQGRGLRLSPALRGFYRLVLPVLILALFVQGWAALLK